MKACHYVGFAMEKNEEGMEREFREETGRAEKVTVWERTADGQRDGKGQEGDGERMKESKETGREGEERFESNRDGERAERRRKGYKRGKKSVAVYTHAI